MREDDVQAAAGRIEELIPPFARVFGKEEARQHARTYLKGLMSRLARKSIEPIAKAMGGGQISALQKFINTAPWHAATLHREVQREFGDWLRRRPSGPVVLGVREHGFAKKGRESVGVARQWNAASGRVENCQSGIFLVAAAGGVSCLLDGRLYLPPSWCDGSEDVRRRRVRTRVPAGTHLRTGPQIALDLLRRCRSMALLEADWVVTGEGFCGDGEALEGLDSYDQHYLIGVPPSEVVFARRPLPHGAWSHAGDPPGRDEIALTVSSLCEVLTADAWRTARVRTPGGVDREEYAVVRVRSTLPAVGVRPLWLVVRGAGASAQDCASPGYYFSNAGPDTPLDQVAEAVHLSESAPAFFREADRYLGLGHYETRSWDGWHHHMSLVALAHWLATSAGADRPAEALQVPFPGLQPNGRETV